MEVEVHDSPEGHNQRHGGLEVHDQVHEVVVQGRTSDSEMYFLWSAPQKFQSRSPKFKQEAEGSCTLWWSPQENHVYQDNMLEKNTSRMG